MDLLSLLFLYFLYFAFNYEAGGGVITRILGIRGVSNKISAKESKDACISRAIIVDTAISEVSSPHIHPIFWRPHNCHVGTPDRWILVQPGMCYFLFCLNFPIYLNELSFQIFYA